MEIHSLPSGAQKSCLSRLYPLVLTALATGLLVPGLPLSAAPEPDAQKSPVRTWELSAGAFFGTCHPDLEKKYHDDILGSTFIVGGTGYSSPWQGNRCGAFPLALQHNMGRFAISGEFVQLSSSHSFERAGQYPFSPGNITFVDSARISSRTNRSITALLEYSLHPETTQGFSLLGGLRDRTINTDLDLSRVLSFSNGSNTVTGASVFPTYSVRQTGYGPLVGVAYQSEILDSVLLSVRVLIFNLHGAWQERQVSVDPVGNGASFRNEDGRFRMVGYDLLLGLERPLPSYPAVSVFLRLRQDYSGNRDSSVNVTKAGSGSQAVSGTALSQDAFLSYGGSFDRDRNSGLEFGIKWRFL